jgi:hypothetical protein
LKALEIKASKYGLECPVSIEVEIVEIKEKIAELGGEIDDLAKYRKLVAIRKTRRKEILEHELVRWIYALQLKSNCQFPGSSGKVVMFYKQHGAIEAV